MLEYKKDTFKAIIALAPAMIILTLFSFYPLFKSFFLAFMDGYNIEFAIGEVFDGFTLNNFISVIQDKLFHKAILNTFLMVIISVPTSIIVSLGVAVSLNSIKKLQGFFQTIFFLPYVTNTIALGLVFATLFNQHYGLVNAFLGIFGKSPVNWKGTGASYWNGLFVLMTYSVWDSLAFKILVFLSGLQAIDKQYYEAAQIDGTPRWRVFLRITVPMLSPMIFYIMITSFIGAFKAYSSVISIFSGRFGPVGDEYMLVTIVGYIYKFIGDSAAMYLWPKAAAASIILLFIILIFTIVQLWASKKRVVY